MATKKLIEVALPLDKINEASAREKSIRYGHPSTLHLWWARRPLAAARAVIWASLVDDPSSHPDIFVTEEDQIKERQRLFKILEDLVVWDNSNDEKVIEAAKNEIFKSTNGDIPQLLDPFAGGGAIPFEAQRLGLVAHAHDLNPVPIMINKAMIEIPPKFYEKAPVNPKARNKIGSDHGWSGYAGLANDLSYYGSRLRHKVLSKVEGLYPKIKLSREYGDEDATVISWIWTRTIKCPNPACGCQMPLMKSFNLSTKKGKEASVSLRISGNDISYDIVADKAKRDGTISRSGAICPCCNATADFSYIRSEASNGRLVPKMVAVVADTKNGRQFLKPDEEQLLASNVERPDDIPSGVLSGKARVNVSLYGFNETADLFTNRQLTTLVEYCNSLDELQFEIENDAKRYGYANDHVPLTAGGTGALAYSQAVKVYLAFGISRTTNIFNALCRWESSRAQALTLFSRQAIPMIWDFAENNPFANAAGDFQVSLGSIIRVVEQFNTDNQGEASQFNAQEDCGYRNIMISTDPPYYDNIDYADLSDFFYVWLRRCLRDVYPDLFKTMLVPKAEELVAAPYRFEGDKQKAKDFFEDGMLQTCKQIHKYAREDIPVTIYYAYKQSETDIKELSASVASTGWETMLSAIVNAGFAISGTWPMRTEMANRAVASGANALASSIVLVCRKRSEDAPQTTRRNLVNSLRRELRPALKKLQESNIAPVDMAQSAIGPGMGVFSRYRRVLEADGTPMTVRSALQVINEEIDLYFNEQVGEMDTASRFCVDLYTQNAYNDIKYGEAEVLANAKGTSIPMMASHGVLYAKAGVVHLIDRSELPTKVDMNEGNVWMLTQQLTHAMATGGVEACAQIILNMFGSNAERAKDLAYRLYTIAEQKKWANEAYAYNALVVAWPDIQSRAAALKAVQPKQLSFFDMI